MFAVVASCHGLVSLCVFTKRSFCVCSAPEGKCESIHCCSHFLSPPQWPQWRQAFGHFVEFVLNWQTSDTVAFSQASSTCMSAAIHDVVVSCQRGLKSNSSLPTTPLHWLAAARKVPSARTSCRSAPMSLHFCVGANLLNLCCRG